MRYKPDINRITNTKVHVQSMHILNSPALIGNLEKDAMRACLGSYRFVEKSVASVG